MLGIMYEKGWGVTQDSAKAVKWFRKAAEQGVALAQYTLGLAYEKGQGVDMDDGWAVRWYRKAAEQGYAQAQYTLGNRHSAIQDYVQALMWFNLAAAKGEENARKRRDNVAKKMTPAQIAEAQRLAREWRPKKP